MHDDVALVGDDARGVEDGVRAVLRLTLPKPGPATQTLGRSLCVTSEAGKDVHEGWDALLQLQVLQLRRKRHHLRRHDLRGEGRRTTPKAAQSVMAWQVVRQYHFQSRCGLQSKTSSQMPLPVRLHRTKIRKLSSHLPDMQHAGDSVADAK